MTVKPGKEAEYEKRHSPIPDDVHAMLKQHGVHNYGIFLLPSTRQLFAYAEVDTEAGWTTIASSPVCKRWWKEMSALVDFHEDGTPVVQTLNEVFHMK